MDPRLRALGERLATAQDQRLQATFDFERARARLLDAVRGSRSRNAAALWATRLVPALAVAVAALWLLVRETPLEFRVNATQPVEAPGGWIAAPPDRSVPITFSDGSELTLLEGARARIVDVKAEGATVIVERGELRVAVVHRKQANWRVFVGPFLVRVIGTRFDVGWQPEAERFSLSLQEGAVVVTGPGIAGERSLHTGETLELSPKDRELVRRAQVAATATSLPAAEEVEPRATDGGAAAPAPLALAQPRRTRPQQTRERPGFLALAQDGKYAEALAAAEAAGFERLCATANARDLSLLADVARLAGAPNQARLAYRAVRERFAGQDAGQAAFFLGRLAFDQHADYTQAARYFALSLEEQPAGPLAREAAGRLIEARVLAGDKAEAQDAARRYLERFSDGPHAKTAKRLLAAP